MRAATDIEAASASGREAGFTLIEVIAVMVIAALLIGALAFIVRPSGGAASLKAVAGDVASGLRHTRSRAIRRGRELVAQIDVSQRRINWGTDRPELSLARGVGIKTTTADSEIRGATAGIRFFPNGSSTGGRIRLSAEKGTHIEVAVNWLTGRVTIEQTQ